MKNTKKDGEPVCICRCGKSFTTYNEDLESYLKNNFLLNSDGVRTDARVFFKCEEHKSLFIGNCINQGCLSLMCTLIPEKVDVVVNKVDCNEFVNSSGLRGIEQVKVKVFQKDDETKKI